MWPDNLDVGVCAAKERSKWSYIMYPIESLSPLSGYHSLCKCYVLFKVTGLERPVRRNIHHSLSLLVHSTLKPPNLV